MVKHMGIFNNLFKRKKEEPTKITDKVSENFKKESKSAPNQIQKGNVGLLFDIDDLGGGFYGGRAQRIIMKNLDPGLLKGATIKVGDTNKTLRGQERTFCIALCNVDITYVRNNLKSVSTQGIINGEKRFLDEPALSREPLMILGSIDSMGRLVTEQWTRIDHDICKECGWGYAPTTISVKLEPNLSEELKQLGQLTK
jgi:hypothetical protein